MPCVGEASLGGEDDGSPWRRPSPEAIANDHMTQEPLRPRPPSPCS